MISEKSFIIKHRERWERLEILLKQKRKSFDEIETLGKMYQQVAEDLSFAQTHFVNSQTILYLNQLVRRCHLLFQRPKKKRFRQIIEFITKVFPKILHKLSIPILISIVLFTSATVVSFVMVSQNVELAEMFLDSRTYEMMRDDIEMRKQFANFDDIAEKERIPISLFIWLNNSKVSVFAFALGITLGLGTVYILIANGFMLGSLMAAYYINGHFADFFSLIMVHGSIELIAIMVAGGAGFAIAGAVLNPLREKRTIKLKAVAKTALQCLIGVVMLLLWAGLVEGLITPLKLPIPIRVLIASVNFLILVAYFIYGTRISKLEATT